MSAAAKDVAEKTVVIVDDEPDVRESLRDIFLYEGYRVETAADGREALEVLRKVAHPCVVILDIIMPVMDGVEVYRAMQGDPVLAKIPVVISTSDPARAPAGVLIMRKPVNVDLLLDTIAKLC